MSASLSIYDVVSIKAETKTHSGATWTTLLVKDARGVALDVTLFHGENQEHLPIDITKAKVVITHGPAGAK